MALEELLAALPEILFYMQIIFFFGLVMVFGRIASFGYRDYRPFWLSWLMILGLGFFSLLGAAGLEPVMRSAIPIDSMIADILLLHFLGAGLLTSIALMAAMLFLSYRMYNISFIESEIERLGGMLNKAKEMRSGKGKSPWPIRAIGICVMAALGVAIAFNYTGFPDIGSVIVSSVTSEPGMPGLPAGTSTECLSLLGIIAQNIGEYNQQLSSNPEVYVDDALERSIEQGSGKSIIEMYRVEVEGKTAIVALGGDGSLCIATEDELCMCQDVGSG